jgi:hypothetical protein
MNLHSEGHAIMSTTIVEGNFDIVRLVMAVVHHRHEDDRLYGCPVLRGRGEIYCLQIELGNDHGITLTVSDNEPPAVSLWHGNCRWSFVRTECEPAETIDRFREFVAAAFEPRP